MNTSYIAITLGFGDNPDNFDKVYNKRLNRFYMVNSRDLVDPTEDALFDKIYETGVPIPESDFINEQLTMIEKVNTKGLKNGHKALLRLYGEYLNMKLSLVEIPKLEQSKTDNPDEVKKPLKPNKYLKIFRNDFGYNLFEAMHDYYKDEGTDLANYSFLFYAMEQDFLVCSQTEFVQFLGNENYDKQIAKIDSRQSGKNKKSKLFNSIKEQLQKKHGISTN